jgi:hypothetical protein
MLFLLWSAGTRLSLLLKESLTSSKEYSSQNSVVTEEVTPDPPQPTIFNQESILNYPKDLPSDEYQQMAEAWGRLTNDEDFSQA